MYTKRQGTLTAATFLFNVALSYERLFVVKLA